MFLLFLFKKACFKQTNKLESTAGLAQIEYELLTNFSANIICL